MAVALIPVKELDQAKERLSPVLDADQRRALALAMFRDVLRAALECPALERVAVVSRDADVLSEAVHAGAEGLAEPGGLNEALTSACRAVAKRGAERLLVLAADIPLATPDAIGAVLAADADVTVVASSDGGTNALAAPPGAIPFLFGKDSARRHLQAARTIGLRALALDVPELALDIDTPDHLERLAVMKTGEEGVGRYTAIALGELGLAVAPVPES